MFGSLMLLALLQLPTLWINASKPAIEEGEAATVSWSASFATNCVGYGPNNWGGYKPFVGEETVTVPGYYAMTCNGPGGSIAKGVNIAKTSHFTHQLDTTKLSNGEHTITIRAYDAAGNMTEKSITVTVNNGDTIAPIVLLTLSLANNSVTARAAASDNVGVKMVEFLVNDVVRATDNVAPYEVKFGLNGPPRSTHRIVARATDTSGNVGTSLAITVTKRN